MQQLNKDILKLAIPSILASITVPLVGMVDIAVAGHLGDGNAAPIIGGISIGTMLFDLLYWNFGFLRVGTGGMTAQAYGAGNKMECGRILARGVGFALLIALGILLIQWPFAKAAFLVVECSDTVRDLALQYFYIRIWAAPATLSLFAFKGWFIGMQDTVSSMTTDLIVNIANIIFSIFLTLGIPGTGFDGIGFAGIALGTLLAQYSGLAFAVARVATKYSTVVKGVGIAESLRGGELRKFMTLNRDLFIRSVCFIVIYVGYTTISARFGDMLLATGSIMMKLLLLFSYFTDGFAYAGEALTGKFIGMRDRTMTARTTKYVFAWSMAISILFIFIYFFAGVPILRIMTSDEAVIGSCRQFFVWLLPMPVIGCAAFTWDGIYAGATAAKQMRDCNMAAVVAFFAVWIAGSLLHPGAYDAASMHILLGAYFAHLLARSVWLTVTFRDAILTRPFRTQAAA
ncbi:MAG: MATE family efflux transporter [Candidatus Cryptobacteroides sp.]